MRKLYDMELKSSIKVSILNLPRTAATKEVKGLGTL